MPEDPPFPPSLEALPFSSSHIADIFGQRTFARGLEYKSKGVVVNVDVDFGRSFVVPVSYWAKSDETLIQK